MNKIRKAKVEDVTTLTEIAFKAKGYWGYSDDFMKAWKNALTITVDDIQSKVIYLLEDDMAIKGFYCLCIETNELETLFVAPTYIGQGLGKRLWNDILLKAKEYKLSSFQFKSDPNEYEFYIKMGAKRIIYVESTVIPGRIYPLMEYTLTHLPTK